MRLRIATHAVAVTRFATLVTKLATTDQTVTFATNRMAWASVCNSMTALFRTVVAALLLLLANAALAQSYVLVSDFGTLGAGNGQFHNPIGLAIDPVTRNIVVADQGNNRVQIFDSAGVYVSQFAPPAGANAQFIAGVAIDPTTRHIVVADSGNNRVQIFDANGINLSQFGTPGTGNGQFSGSNPYGIAIDPTSHNIVVQDAARIEIFDSTGNYLSQFGSPGLGNGQFSLPSGLAIDPATRNILVADTGNNRIQIYDSTGMYLSEFGAPGGSGNGQLAGPVFVAVDPATSNIAVSDNHNSRVQVFSSQGTYLSQVGAIGAPQQLAFDPVTHDILVVTVTNARVDILGPTSGPGPDLNQHGLTGSWYKPATAGQGIEIEMFPDQVAPGTGQAFLSWFTYDTVVGGADHQRWYTLSGSVVTGQPSASLTIYQNINGNFDAPPITMSQPVGIATLSFDTCTSGQLSYSFTDGTGRTGSIALTRLTQNVTCSTTTPHPTNADFALSGNWFESATSGQGFTAEVNPNSGQAFAAWYTYAPGGAGAGATGQRWYTAQGAFTPGMRSIPVQIFANTGGLFDAPPVTAAVLVGTGTLAFQSCSAATFNFSFTGGSSSGQSGVIPLTRVGPVPPGCTS